MMVRILCILGVFFCTGSAWATCVAVDDTTAVLPTGQTDGVTVVWRADRIEAVGKNVPIPAGCTVVDGRGGVLTAGFVDPYTELGITEVGLEKSTRDHQPGKGMPYRTPEIRPSFRVYDAYNPRSTLIPLARYSGVTSALTVPAGGIVSGQSIWVDLAGSTQQVAVIRDGAGMHVRVGGGERSRAVAFHALENLLTEAKVFQERRADWAKAKSQPFQHSPLDLTAMLPVLDKKIPLVVDVNRASDIEAMLRLTARHDLRWVIVGGGEAWMHAAALAKAKVGVIVNPLIVGPQSFDQVHARPDNAALLHAAGVPVMISTFWTHNMRTLGQVAGNAVRAGLPHKAALDAITATPAQVFGLTHYGRIAPGAVANVVLWSGDPLELTTSAKSVWIHGRSIALENRQTKLRDHYLRSGGTPAPLPLPSPSQKPGAEKRPPLPTTFVKGPSISPSADLLRWLGEKDKQCGQSKVRTVQLPVRIESGTSGRTAAIGAGKTTRPDAIPLRLDDTTMGIPLTDHMRRHCKQAGAPCVLWLQGCWGVLAPAIAPKPSQTKTWPFSVRRVRGPVPMAEATHVRVLKAAP